uniref:NADH:ubiquinone oxidoreductase, Na translocating, B subunit n=1 Tax=Fervidobacterium thailandense TaxID=1008305 RepID=A0A7C5RIX9_9BACT
MSGTSSFFQKQPMMRRMLLALLPIYVFSIFAYGPYVIFLSFVVFTTGIFVEYLFESRKNKPVSEAVLVTCMLLTLAMPPRVPLWLAIIATAFAVVFGKEVYGGFGRNVFNPAITGRLFVYITFPLLMTKGWVKPSPFGVDLVTSATPLEILRHGGSVGLLDLFLGWRAGSIGEAPIFLIIASAIYLIVTKTASWRIIISTLISAFVTTLVFDLANVANALPTIPAILSGSLLFVAIFMATDPISAPKKAISHWYYGVIIGVSGVIIRTFSLFPEGWSFALLLGNTFAPLLDEIVKEKKKPSSKKVTV